jgi:hypothetical protein
MISYKKIDYKLLDVFGLNDFTTLSNVKSKIRYELGNNHKDKDRFNIAFSIATELLNKYFRGKSLYIRLILWDEIDESILLNPIILPLMKFLKFKKIEDGSLVLYFLLDVFNLDLIDGLIKSSIGYELGMDNTLNMTCFYFDSDFSIILNIYDDRGLDVIKL